MASTDSGRVIVITGAMAAGKTTVAKALAARLPRSVLVGGNVFRRMVVNRRVEMSSERPRLHTPSCATT